MVTDRFSLRWLLPVLFWLAIGLLAGGMPASAAHGQTIYVKLLVDEEEPAVAARWEARLKDRLAAASQIIADTCDIRFVARETGTWKSDNRLSDFNRTLSEFEQEVDPGMADLAIGFTSQYRFQPGRANMGGTRGPLHPHILIRESNPQVVESERVEVLAHELGHYLGAVHSRRTDSVMRPVLGDGQARAKKFRIAFDPDNARLMRLVAAEIKLHGVQRVGEFTSETRDQLRSVYARLAREYPEDPAAAQYYRKFSAATVP